MLKYFRAFVAAGLVLVSGLASAQNFSNSFDYGISPFGMPGATNTGQAFTTGGGVLTDWTFYAYGANFSGDLYLVIADWNWALQRAVGPALYTSSVVAYSGGVQALAFTGINLSLAADDYIAYLTTAGLSNPAGSVTLGGSNSDGGMPGELHYLYSGGVNPLTLTTAWSGGEGFNMQYSANFANPVPEPETYAMMLAGLGLLGLMARRRKMKPAA
jgi:hypothetical protein